MDTIFWLCVEALRIMAGMLGISYQALNVILFVIIHPLITLILFVQYRRYRKFYRDKMGNE